MTPRPEIDPAVEAGQLADLFNSLSQALDDFRTGDNVPADTTPQQLAQLKKQAQALEDISHFFTAEAIGATLQSIQPDLANIKAVTADAKTQVGVLNSVSKAISIATAALAVGTAIGSGDLPALGGAVEGFVSAVGGS